jgi:hypothetical protein
MLSSDKNKLVDKVNTAFASIGKGNGTKMPPSTNNADSYAYDLWVSHQLVSLANKRKELAEKACIKAGIMLDKEKDPRPEGTKEVLFSGDNVAISLNVSGAATRINTEKLLAYLVEHGVPNKTLDEAIASASSKSRPAHVFSTYLLTND